MMKKRLSFTAGLVLCAFLGSGAFGQHTVRGVLGNGGAVLTGSEYNLHGTTGQPIAGFTESTEHSASAGYWFSAGDYITEVSDTPDNLPAEFRLEQNFPNPFNPTTTIVFALPKSSDVFLGVYDMRGRLVCTLVNGCLTEGRHDVVLNAEGLSTGVYFYAIRVGSFTERRKLLLVK